MNQSCQLKNLTSEWRDVDSVDEEAGRDVERGAVHPVVHEMRRTHW